MLLSSFVVTNFTAAEIGKRELEVRKLLDTSPKVFSYGCGFDPHDPNSIEDEKPETHFADVLGRCLANDRQPSVYLIGKLETSIDGGPRPLTFNVLFLPELLAGNTMDVHEFVRATLYERALSFLVEQSLIKDPPPTGRARRIGSTM